MLFKEAKKIITRHKDELLKLGAHALSIFGSTAREESTAKSDVDVLVDFDSDKGIFGFLDLREYLETILKCKVDLVTRNALHWALKDRILSESRNVF